MSLSDALDISGGNAPPQRRARPDHPTGFEYSWDGEQGFVQTGPLEERPRTWDAFIRDAGLDPDEVEIVGDVQVRGWDANTGGGNVVRMHYYKINLRRKVSQGLPDLAALRSEIRRVKRKPKPTGESCPVESAVVVCFADPQTGKVASRGGTKELLLRAEDKFGALDSYIAEHRPDAAYWLDLGDAVESFENTPGQAFTNDLSIMRQVEVAADIERAGIDVLAKRTPRVVVAGVGSNHCQWRRGKDRLGNPSEDWGLHILRQLAGELKRNPSYQHVTVRWPEQHEETLSLDIAGTIVGLAHGHQVSRPEQIPAWFARQVHGGQPIAHADILVTGHFHEFRCQPTGRSPHSGRSKWWLQAPTMDNASDWYRYRAGSDSDPGLLVFQVTADGWDRLRIL